jgi:hypothetical protein
MIRARFMLNSVTDFITDAFSHASGMRKTPVLIAALALFAALGMAQDEAQYKTWMQGMRPAMMALNSAPDNAAAAADATKLADTFSKVAAFWQAKHADDAVKFAETARDAAKAIASGSGDKAANLKTIQGTCGGCHMAHREGTAPNFTMK